ncbi:hypothetical protein [Saccharopolyspora dendranthemae]|uniref:Uncharacterized protein n=1 Tax=Saccharopolyspora dendranthemae TaxID=1181886 RepID=A0A561V789_9PSEU|nr:hypothetical protein [Saccharopolyspora dendranthemae]TWG07482.1 hypothetical protein FHU35_1198 [Saccharopolyspora dendranthemae]
MSTPSDDRDGDGVESRTLHVSDALQARLDTFRESTSRTTTSATFEAIAHFRAELPELVRGARARLTSPVADEAEVRYLGAGPVQLRLRPDAAGAELLDRLSAKLGLPWTTWVPAVLNAYLPGRQEPENMPWLVREAPRS